MLKVYHSQFHRRSVCEYYLLSHYNFIHDTCKKSYRKLCALMSAVCIQ